MTRHTPGPWEAKGYTRPDGQGDLQVGRAEVGPRCITALAISQGDTPSAFSEQEANARLIAAAPDLLDFVRRWENEMTDGGVLDALQGWKREFAEEARTVLAKVDGL